MLTARVFDERRYVAEQGLKCTHKDVCDVNRRLAKIELQLRSLFFLSALGVQHCLQSGLAPAQTSQLEANAMQLLEDVETYVAETREQMDGTLALVTARRSS